MYNLQKVDAAWVSVTGILPEALQGVEPGQPTADVIEQIIALQVRHSTSPFERVMLEDVDPKAIARYLQDLAAEDDS